MKAYSYFLMLLLMVGGGAVIIFGIYISFAWQASFQYGMGLFLLPIVSIVGGLLLLFGSPIIFAVKNERQKRFDSMSQSDLAKMFDCPGSENRGVVHLIKLVKDQILVKKSCPTLYPPSNRPRLLKIPLRLKDQSVPYFRDAIFRCYKCGQKATVDHVKFSGPWTLIKLSCPTHGKKLPTHKIWSTVYSDISNE